MAKFARYTDCIYDVNKAESITKHLLDAIYTNKLWKLQKNSNNVFAMSAPYLRCCNISVKGRNMKRSVKG